MAKKTTQPAFIETPLTTKKETKPMKQPFNRDAVKAFGNKVLNWVIIFACDLALASFAIIGVMSLIHTERTVQTTIAVFFVLLLLVAKSKKQ